MNSVNLIGRIVFEPETRETGNTSVTRITVATDRVKLNAEGKSYKDPQTGYTAKETEFHKVTIFNGQGRAVAEHKKKGDTIGIEGRNHYTRWTDQSGNERFGCEVIAEKVHFC